MKLNYIFNNVVLITMMIIIAIYSINLFGNDMVLKNGYASVPSVV